MMTTETLALRRRNATQSAHDLAATLDRLTRRIHQTRRSVEVTSVRIDEAARTALGLAAVAGAMWLGYKLVRDRNRLPSTD